MEVYRRITERVRGALWAHHRRLMPERQFHRILAYVYNNKYEYQIRLDQMEVVGSAWGGKVEVATTPAGFMKKVRVHPDVAELSPLRQKQLMLDAYAQACAKGKEVMQAAEQQVYRQFLMDLKPIIMGIRDNPEFYTVAESSVETMGGTLKTGPDGEALVHRTIPASKAHQPQDEFRRRLAWEQRWLSSPQGSAWSRTLRGKEYLSKHQLEQRVRGAPGAKKRTEPFELLAPYTPMDEARLQRKNWMAYLDNVNVAQQLWTRSMVAGREKKLCHLQEKGEAWHRPVNRDAVERW